MKMEQNKEQKIEDLVQTIDRFMSGGGGHMNVAVDDLKSGRKDITTTNSVVCQGNNMACCTPTLHEGLDAEEE